MNKDNYPDNMPEKFRPIRPWGYVGYFWLFAIPIVGLVFLIIYATDDSNVNRRNLARGFLWNMLIGFVIGMVASSIVLICIGTIISNNAKQIVSSQMSQMDNLQTNAFNNQFLIYTGNDRTAYETRSLINRVKAHNANKSEVEDYGIIELTGEYTSASQINNANKYDISPEYGPDGYICAIAVN